MSIHTLVLDVDFRTVHDYLTRLATAAPLDGPWPAMLDEDTSGLLRAMADVLSNIRETVDQRLSPALGIRTGVNASESD